MKTIIYKIFILSLVAAFTFNPNTMDAQFGGKLKDMGNKAKDKLTKTKTKKEEPASTTPAPTSESPKVEEAASTPAPESVKEEAPKEEAPKEITYYETQGVTSPIHEKYMNQIVFSTEDLLIGKEDESKFITEFVAGDVVYYRVYMDNSMLNNLMKQFPTKKHTHDSTHGRYKFVFSVNGEETYSYPLSESLFTSGEKKKMTTFRGALKVDDGTPFIGVDAFENFLLKGGISTGTQDVQIAIVPMVTYPEDLDCKPFIGTLKMTVKDGFIDPKDESMCMPAPKMNSASLNSKILTAFADKGWTKDHAKKAIVLQRDWAIRKNEYTGLILDRSIDAGIAFEREGKCYYQVFAFTQDYNGSGYQENATYLNGVGDQKQIHCDCLK